MSDTVQNKTFEEMNDTEKEAFMIKHYLEISNNKAALEDLKADIETKRQGFTEVWATGFESLDNMLEGGFFGTNLIFLGAVSSLGKTSFALQMATQMAERGKDVLIFSLEMGKDELNAKNISRYTHINALKGEKKHENLKGYRLTTRDILNGKIGELGTPKRELFNKSLEDAQKISDHIFIIKKSYSENLSVDDVKMWVDFHIKARKTKPFVIIDYLQILDPSEHTSFNDRRNLTDYDVRQLKGIAEEYKLPLLCISAFNRASYLDPVSMGSFRESSGIEYSSDILLGLQFKGMEYAKHYFTDPDTGKKKQVYENDKDHNTRVRDLMDLNEKKGANGSPQDIEIKILKSRNGIKGVANMTFTPKYNYYEDQGAKQTMLIEDDLTPPFEDIDPWKD